MSHRSSFARRALVTTAVVAGAGLGAAGIASAATTNPTTSTSASSSSHPKAPAPGSYGSPPAGGQINPATLPHGPNETLLTGTALQKAVAAAKAAVPGATVIRAETDSSGASAYEVHMKKADGTYVTVELNSSFNAVRTISGFGAGPAGGPPPRGGQPPAGATPPRAA